MKALAPLACNNLYHKSFWTHDDVNESRLSSWFAFYQSFVLWPSFNFCSVSSDPWTTKAVESAPSRCQRHCTAAAWGLSSVDDLTNISAVRACVRIRAGDVNVRAWWENAIIAVLGHTYHHVSALLRKLWISHMYQYSCSFLFFNDPVCCTDCCKYQTLYFSLLIIQYCNIFNIK